MSKPRPSTRSTHAAINALIARSSVGESLRALQQDPERELAAIDEALTPEVMEQLRSMNNKRRGEEG